MKSVVSYLCCCCCCCRVYALYLDVMFDLLFFVYCFALFRCPMLRWKKFITPPVWIVYKRVTSLLAF